MQAAAFGLRATAPLSPDGGRLSTRAYSFNRMFRNSIDAAITTKELGKCGTRVVAPALRNFVNAEPSERRTHPADVERENREVLKALARSVLIIESVVLELVQSTSK